MGTILFAALFCIAVRFIILEIAKAAAIPDMGHDYLDESEKHRRAKVCLAYNATVPAHKQVHVPGWYR